MHWAHIVALQHAQAACSDPPEQLRAGAQAQMLCQIGQHQPAFAAGRQVRRQPRQKGLQHAAAFVVHRMLDGRARPRRHPGRVADDERRLPFGEQVHVLQRDLLGQAQPLQVVPGAGQGARGVFGGYYAAHTAARQHGGEHAGASADVKRQLLGRQRRFRNQVDVFTAHRREDAVVRVNAVAGRIAQRCNFHALFTPFVRADHTQQFAQ